MIMSRKQSRWEGFVTERTHDRFIAHTGDVIIGRHL